MLNKAVIDLNVIRENALAVKSKLKNKAKFCAVVKADAYGHGAVKIASCLYTVSDFFAVATTEEGVELRRGGIDKPVLVFTAPKREDLANLVRFNLTATVDDLEQVKMLFHECKRQNKIVDAHLKINTGMNRHGVDGQSEIRDMLALFSRMDRVKLTGAYTHFGFPENKKHLKRAVNKFLLANNLIKGYNNRAICHASASGGFLQGEYFDMVRIGILLYGYKPFSSELISVKPAMKVFAPVLKTRTLKKGDYALYGNEHAKEDTVFSLVRYGYADGLFRKKIEGQFNNRCMDVTALVGKAKEEWQVVMDDADKIAKEYGTISYEILTKSAFRAEKIYLN